MDKVTASELATKIALSFPVEVTTELAGVDLMICLDAAEAAEEVENLYPSVGPDGKPIEVSDEEKVTAETKGLFVGEPMVVEDSDDTEKEETVFLPEGHIFLVASNIKDEDELTLVLMHEIGHALGLDEDEVKNLGLGVTPATEVPIVQPATVD